MDEANSASKRNTTSGNVSEDGRGKARDPPQSVPPGKQAAAGRRARSQMGWSADSCMPACSCSHDPAEGIVVLRVQPSDLVITQISSARC